MSSLAERSTWLLMLVFIGGLALVAVACRLLGRRVFGDAQASASSIATPLMPALGTAFAVLAAFTVADAASHLRGAEADVSREASAASRLAWASTATTDRGAAIQRDLLAYLDATLSGEWRDIDRISPGDGPAFADLTNLERTVRTQEVEPSLGTPRQTELLASLDDVSGARRSRFAAAAPTSVGLMILLVLSAVALVVNATVVTLGRERRAALALSSLVLVTGMSIASVVSLGAPFSGSFRASARPLADVANDVRAGRFQLGP